MLQCKRNFIFFPPASRFGTCDWQNNGPQWWASLVAQMVKNLPAVQEIQIQSWVRKIPWRREWQPTAVFLLGESHGQRSLAGYSLWDHKELDVTEATKHTRTQYSLLTTFFFISAHWTNKKWVNNHRFDPFTKRGLQHIRKNIQVPFIWKFLNWQIIQQNKYPFPHALFSVNP